MIKIFLIILTVVVLVSAIVITTITSKVGENKAFGSYDRDGKYFCDPENEWLARTEYRDEVIGIEQAVKFFDGPILETNNYLLGNNNMKRIDEVVRCLKEEFNIEPDSVSMFNDRTLNILSYDIPRLMETAPHLVQYATVSTQGKTSSRIGGCLIATAAFDSELAPQIQILRELRDDAVLGTNSGTSFMAAFNQFYYSFSPTVADWERQNPVFKDLVKVTITPMLSTLSVLNYVDIDSDQEMLGYGIGIILLNIGIYFVVPTFVLLKIRRIDHH